MVKFNALLPRLISGITLNSIFLASAAQAITVTGTFSDPIIPSLYPGSTLTGNFSFDSASINPQGFVAFNDTAFSALETSNIPVDNGVFNGTDWSFSPSSPFVFNTQTKLFEGVYELNRTCLKACPPGTLGQSISNPNTVFWDPSPGQVVTITGEIPPTQPIPEPLSVIGTLIGGAAVWRMRKKLTAATEVKVKQ